MSMINLEKVSRDEAINLILSSIAMEEAALSHVINAEGEKIQYALGTLEGKPPTPASIDDILKINASVKSTLEASNKNQIVLTQKMGEALKAPTMQGPTGPQGPQGDPGIEIISITEEGYIVLPAEQKLDAGILWVIYPDSIN
ncbi:MAG: hypothetical protein FWF81_14705 [Defluviitaleaceae bacterium]|nr:hypothetical protein [Defluviitaleaceae bacterium]